MEIPLLQMWLGFTMLSTSEDADNIVIEVIQVIVGIGFFISGAVVIVKSILGGG